MAVLAPDPLILSGTGWDDYGLIDSGHGRKFERYGDYRFIRPEPQALWTPRLSEWDAHGEFIPASDEDGGGKWHFSQPVPLEGWELARGALVFNAQCTPFRHLGFFPDMAPVWDWMGVQLSPLLFRGGAGGGESQHGTAFEESPHPNPSPLGEGLNCLNLFGYTGLGTLALSEFGPVTHVDASKKSVAQARLNAAMSGMENRPIRWLIDDATRFTAREVRRGRRYDGIMLDPPKFGRGPDGELWHLEHHLPALVRDCRSLLDADSRFLFLTVYAVRMSALALAGLLMETCSDLPGVIEFGELAVAEVGADPRLLPTAIFARWSNTG